MSLIDDLVSIAGSRDYELHEIIVGDKYTLAIADVGGVMGCGMAYVFRHMPITLDIDIPAIIHSSHAHTLLASGNPLEASVGLAVVNAILNTDREGNEMDRIYERCDSYEYMARAIKKSRCVAFIGYFRPLIERYRALLEGRKYYVFETRPIEGTLPADMEDEILPECDFAIVSASALVIHTLEHILKLCEGRAIVLGPSTPITPLLFRYGACAIGGMRPSGPGALQNIRKVISEGGGRWAVDPYMEPVCWSTTTQP